MMKLEEPKKKNAEISRDCTSFVKSILRFSAVCSKSGEIARCRSMRKVELLVVIEAVVTVATVVVAAV